MKINIKDVLKNDTEKADLHSEHWLTDAMEAEEKSAPEESKSAEMPDTDSDPGVKLSNLKCRILIQKKRSRKRRSWQKN